MPCSWAREESVILPASDVIKRLEWIRRSCLPPFFYFHRVCVDMIISSKLDQLSPLLSWKTRLEKFYVNFPLGILAILSWVGWIESNWKNCLDKELNKQWKFSMSIWQIVLNCLLDKNLSVKGVGECRGSHQYKTYLICRTSVELDNNTSELVKTGALFLIYLLLFRFRLVLCRHNFHHSPARHKCSLQQCKQLQGFKSRTSGVFCSDRDNRVRAELTRLAPRLEVFVQLGSSPHLLLILLHRHNGAAKQKVCITYNNTPRVCPECLDNICYVDSRTVHPALSGLTFLLGKSQ